MSDCRHCPKATVRKSHKTGGKFDYTVALAGNPNTGKSTVFNTLSGLRQHTGNWPGKTVTTAEGAFTYAGKEYRITDLPGTYSLLSTSEDEEIARNHILFDKPDVVVIVADATRLERNLNLVLQITRITSKAVLAVNLLDEAKRNGVRIDLAALGRRLGIPVIGTSAREKRGIPELLEVIRGLAEGQIVPNPAKALPLPEELTEAITQLSQGVGTDKHDTLSTTLYAEVARICAEVVHTGESKGRAPFDVKLDRIVTSRLWGFPLMFLMLGVVLWLTIIGSNYPSEALSNLLVGTIHPWLKEVAAGVGIPPFVDGLLFDGIYLATAWVVSVMLPPMAIFFPLFTLLEDFGFLPRVAFNLDELFRRSGAHGKQALTMSMGFGCNAAGIVSCRIIDSPRERLIAIITNNFSLCNGRWPTQILIAGIFIGAALPPPWNDIAPIFAVFAVMLLGVAFAFACSLLLSRTVLKGQVSTFNLELPPYRPPHFWQTIYTSLIDRTLIVLWRAVLFAAPAGALIWLTCNINIAGESIALHLINFFDAPGRLMGLNGVILLAYVLAVPANEIVVPTILMLSVLVLGTSGEVGAGAGVMFEDEHLIPTLLHESGWTLLTGINLMLFCLLHNPCSTAVFTIYKETKSLKWTSVATLLPLFTGIAVTILVATVWHLLT